MAHALDRTWIETNGMESAARNADDARLVERAQRDRAAFAELYDRYLPAVYRYCYLRLGGREAAEDATSIIFTKAMSGIAACRPDRLRSWLFAIARNVVVDRYRKRERVEPLDDALEIEDPARSPLDEAVMNDDERRVMRLLDRLSPEQREVVELRLAGLTGGEIAAALGRTPGAIRAAQFRAYGRLRELLAGHTEREGSSR